jgi:hypothetical protein
MRYEVLSTPYPDVKLALKDLKEKIEKVDFEPNLGIFFLTENLIKHHNRFSDLLNCDTVCMPIEGYITPESIWMRGGALILMDAKYRIYKFTGSASKVSEGLEKAKRHDFNILIYPLFYPSSRLELFRAVLRERRYYWSYTRGDLSALRKASELLEEKFFYPINKILRPLRDKGVAAVSFNLFPIEIKFGHPIISLNGKKVGRGVIMIGLDEKIEADYSDTLPERGKSFDETVEILKNEFNIKMGVKVEKQGIAIGHVDGHKLVDYVRQIRGAYAPVSRDVTKDLENGKFLGASPYHILFVSEETFGATLLGVLDYPLGIYPSLYNLDFSSDRAFIILNETIKGGVERMKDEFEERDFNFFTIDQNYILMYENRILKIREYIPKNSFGVFTTHTSFCSPYTTNFMTEIEKRICLNVTRTLTFYNV